MSIKKRSILSRLKLSFVGFLAFISILTGVSALSPNVYAAPDDDTETTEVVETTEDETETATATEEATSETEIVTTGNGCKDSMGALGWVVCPAMDKISDFTDWIYSTIKKWLVINPIDAKDGTPIYEIWKYCLNITNFVFVIFLLIVIYSQITGLGISNYGLKKALPKLIVMAVLVNLSFVICQLAVDVSNILGSSIRGIFETVQESAFASVTQDGIPGISFGQVMGAVVGGGALTIAGVAIAVETGAIWMLIPTILGAAVAVATGLITIALRQAVVVLLIMISPLAMVANILPNTEQWFKKWKALFTKMLVFYPVFSLLFGAASLAGMAIIMSSSSIFGVILGLAVQIFPLFFSWKLMQMSGTFLGDINAKLRQITDKPLAANRGWADQRRQRTNLNFLAYGRTPSSHLRRYISNRQALREQHINNLRTTRANQANMYAQRKISGGYDGTKATGTSQPLKPNKYTRAAKDASTTTLQSETATMDTKHVLSNYGSYFVNEDVKKRIAAAEKAKDKKKAERIKASDPESIRADQSAHAFLEYSRAQMTAENDNEADFNFMVSQFFDASTHFNPNPADGKIDEEAMRKYRHYIVSSAGGLGETGQTRVLGRIIARAAAVESNQRRDINIVAQKWPPDKRSFRNFLFNYYVDDDGFATDKEGNRIETMRDDLRVNHPEKLVQWEHSDEYGPYFDWYDTNGAYVTRIYKKDKSAIKELMSNFDVPINDPINNLFAIHAGIAEQPNSDIEVLKHMGLDGFRTTIGRALLAAPFKEKNAAFSPMVAEMVKKGYIKNYAQEYLAYLDSFNKATKPGAFNVQDADAIGMFAAMMDPDKWDELFPTELIRGYKNVNGEPIYGIRYDEEGNAVKVPAEEATREELMERVKTKFIAKAGPKIITMMSRQTQNTMDNQKPGTLSEWKKLKEVFDTKWGEGKAFEVDPYATDGDMRKITKDIREAQHPIDDDEPIMGGSPHVNHSAQIYEIFNSSLDADDFAVRVSEYCSSFSELAWVADSLQDYIVGEGFGLTIDQIYEKVEELLAYVDYD